MSQSVVLMIEDNSDILRTNKQALELVGYRVFTATTLKEGRAAAKENPPDLILLDILLPDGNGLDYCRELFGQRGPRILFLSALNTKAEVISGLRAGGDDYLTKPYLMEELLARVEALLRRPAPTDVADTIQFGGLTCHPLSGRAHWQGADLLLSRMEYAVLEYLLRNSSRYTPAEEIYQTLWGQNTLDDLRTVWEHISRLRKKLAGTPLCITSRRGQGYQLVDTAPNLAKN